MNFASLGNELGTSANTMRHWLSVLEASWIVVQLPPWYENFGKRVENWVIAEYLKGRWNAGREARIHFFRDQHGSEVDLLLSRGNVLVPIEIKSSRTFAPHHLKGIRRFRELAGDRVEASFLVFGGEDRGSVDGVRPIGFDELGTIDGNDPRRR